MKSAEIGGYTIGMGMCISGGGIGIGGTYMGLLREVS